MLHPPELWFYKLYSPRFKCQQGKEGNIPYIPLFTKAYGSLRVKKEGNIASGYFVIFITRICAENLGTSDAYCAFCNNGAQIGLRALYCDVRTNHTQGMHTVCSVSKISSSCTGCSECWFDDVFATFHARKLCAV